MKDTIKNLLKVKSIITIVLTLVFAIMLVVGIFIPVVIPQEFVMVYTTVISFYFGTRYQKGKEGTNVSTSNENADPS